MEHKTTFRIMQGTSQKFPCTCAAILTVMVLATTVTSEAGELSLSPTALSYTASSATPTPPSQSVTFSKNSIVSRSWTASVDAPWITVSPSTGTLTREQDQITVKVNASGMGVGTYNGTVSIISGGKQNSAVPVTLVVSGGTATTTSSSTTSTSSSTTSTPSILLNPVSLSFSGTAGGTAPLGQTFNLSNPTGGTLTWTLTESASWLGLNVASGTTTTEIDAISASVSTSGLAAGTYSTAIAVTASGASNSPQTIPVTLTLNPPTTNGTASLSWDPSTNTSLAGYNVYMGTQPGIYGSPTSAGLNTSYTVGSLTGGKTYYFAVTAVDTAGVESSQSNEVSKVIQ